MAKAQIQVSNKNYKCYDSNVCVLPNFIYQKLNARGDYPSRCGAYWKYLGNEGLRPL